VHAVLFLADRFSSHITGAVIDVNGGLFLAQLLGEEEGEGSQ